jgi:hypothetical protein
MKNVIEKLNELYTLIRLAKADKLPIDRFCNEFERIYNLELDKKAVSKMDLAPLEVLFNKVIWYSPYSEERLQIPNYLGETEIRDALARFPLNPYAVGRQAARGRQASCLGTQS